MIMNAKPGDIVDRFRRRHQTPSNSYRDATTGELLAQVPASGNIQPVNVVFCPHCGNVEAEGLVSIFESRLRCPRCKTVWDSENGQEHA